MIDLLLRGITQVAPRYPKGTPLVAYVNPVSAGELRTPEAIAILEKWNTRLVETADDLEPGYVEVARA